MNRDAERHKLFNRRSAMLLGGQAVLFSTLVGRMYYLQVLESERYKTLAEENRINLRLLPPPRGGIVDRFGIPIASNQKNYRVLLIPEDTRDVSATLGSSYERLPEGSPPFPTGRLVELEAYCNAAFARGDGLRLGKAEEPPPADDAGAGDDAPGWWPFKF